jgi:hypothetical protein
VKPITSWSSNKERRPRAVVCPADRPGAVEKGHGMSDSSRRNFLAMAGAGAAVGVTAVALPAGASAAEDVSLPGDAEGVLVAYVRDVKAGELALMIDGDERIVTDKQLVARLARAYAKAARA